MSYIYNLFKIKSGLDINNIIYLGKERKKIGLVFWDLGYW